MRKKFLIDKGAEIAIVKGATLRPGFDSEPTKGINVRGMAKALLKTEGTVTLKLQRMRLHTFHVM
jgi:hypothetical protein